MHKKDKEYFKNYIKKAEQKGLTAEDYYYFLQKEQLSIPYEPCNNIVPQKLYGMKIALNNINENQSLLLVGCGNGFEVEWFQKHGINNITGLDIDESHLKRVKKNYNIDTICADMQNTKLPNKSFDVVMTRQSLHHMFYPYVTLAELTRISKDMVIIISEPQKTWFKETYKKILNIPIISDFNIYEYQFNKKDMTRYMAFYGFKLLIFRSYLERRFNLWLYYPLSTIPFLHNRFTAIYKRMS